MCQCCDCACALIQIGTGIGRALYSHLSLFLIVMNPLLQRIRHLKCGGSIPGTFASCWWCLHYCSKYPFSCISILWNCTSVVGLRLNTSKLELIQVSQTPTEPIQIQVGDHLLTTKQSARCLGIQWQSSLSASESVKTNISKARKAFFGLGSTGVFHGKLNPLSGLSIFETLSLSCCMAVKPGYWIPHAFKP